MFDVPLYMMALVGSIHIPNMHSAKMYSLGSAQTRNAKNMALRNIYWKNIFPSILLYGVVLMILSNFYYRIHHKITLPSLRNQRFKKNGLILQSPVQNPEITIQSTLWILIDRLQKKTRFMKLDS